MRYLLIILLFSTQSYGQVSAYKTTVDATITNASGVQSITKAIVGARFKELADIVQYETDSSLHDADTLNRVVARKQLGDTSTAIRSTISSVQSTLTSSITSTNTTLSTFTGSFIVASGTLDFPATLTQRSSDLTISVPSASRGDIALVGTDVILSNSSLTAFCSTNGSVTVRFNNYSGSTQDPTSGSYKVLVIKLSTNN